MDANVATAYMNMTVFCLERRVYAEAAYKFLNNVPDDTNLGYGIRTAAAPLVFEMFSYLVIKEPRTALKIVSPKFCNYP